MSVAVFIIIFLSLFGPKIAGVVDLSVVGGLFGLAFLLFFKKVLVCREYVVVVTFVSAVAFYSMLVVSFNGFEDIHPILRHFRALISTALLGLFFYNLAINSVLSSVKLTNILIAVLLVNAIVIIASIFIPEIKSYLAGLYGFNKKFVALRSFGLTAGYDTAGYLCIFGAIFSFARAYYKTGISYSIIALVFIVAAIFTSRSAMMLAATLITGVCVVFVLKGRWSLKVISVGYIVAGVSVAFYYVVPLILSSFFFQTSDVDYTSNYAVTDLSSWYETMWILPEHTASVLLGTGKVVQTSDLGYVRMIYMIGVLGLLLVALMYIYMFFVIKALSRSAKCGCFQIDLGGRVLVFSLLAILLLMYIINFKNLYFLSRGYHELIVILFFFILGLAKKRVSVWGYAD
ncbi:MAG: hypothetical protein QNL62_13250 [Gammaproteobacteria bacterium]|nr:hypothetical protein [Gammaproteobacteria bacterium]